MLYLYTNSRPIVINLENNLTKVAIDKIKKENNITKAQSISDLNITINSKPLEFNDQNSSDQNKSKDLNLTNENLIKDNNLTKDENLTDQNITLEQNITNINKFDVKIPTGKPKLAFIIDDVGNKKQVEALLRLNMILTPSIFPPNKDHPDTPSYAKLFRCFMIHYPMEANHYSRPEIGTLLSTDSEDRLKEALKKLREDFPTAKFINNHTGSKFTSTEAVIRKILPIMHEFGFNFIDSLTINTSVVKQITEELGYRYIYRSVFIDNSSNINSIQNMIKKAVAVAKKRGFAIAIGHPRPNTIKALSMSRNLLKDVELVYIDQIYEYYK